MTQIQPYLLRVAAFKEKVFSGFKLVLTQDTSWIYFSIPEENYVASGQSVMHSEPRYEAIFWC